MLSDSCHEFLSSIGAAAVTLQAAVEHYAEPPFCYRTEDISNIRSACEAVVSTVSDAPWKPDAMLALVSAAYLTLKSYDEPPRDE
jgi:hypothetical protein